MDEITPEIEEDILFADEDEGSALAPSDKADGWKIVIVDDEQEIHEVTKLALSDFFFNKKGLCFLSAYSGEEAKRILEANPDTVLVLLDVVMERDDAGLQVVKFVRDVLKNHTTRIVLRTGQPGYFPERSVITSYDINDYKEKHELTAQKLFTTIVAAIRSYCDLITIRETAVMQERLQGELKIATDIQLSMMPRHFPLFPERHDIDVHAHIQTAYEVGGDFYDIFFLDEKHLCFFIGDVSGKGIGAALYMMTCRTLLRREVVSNRIPSDVLGKVNQFLCAHNTKGMFATMILGVLDTSTGEIRYSNAGHNPPYLKGGAGKCEEVLLPPGYPLGLFEEGEFSDKSLSLNKGDKLVLYTDGVTEAVDTSMKIFGTDKLNDLIGELNGCGSQELVGTIVDNVHLFAKGAPQADDITIVSVGLSYT